MKQLILTLVLICAAIPLHAQTNWASASRTELDQHDTVAAANLTPTQLSALTTLFNKSLHGCNGLPGLDSGTALQSQRIRAVSLGGDGKQFVLQATDNCLCGATGNCKFWILDATMKALLTHTAQTFAILPQTTFGYHDIVLSQHGSAFESFAMLYQFTGQYYKRTQCADLNYHPDPNAASGVKTPKITIVKCQP